MKNQIKESTKKDGWVYIDPQKLKDKKFYSAVKNWIEEQELIASGWVRYKGGDITVTELNIFEKPKANKKVYLAKYEIKILDYDHPEKKGGLKNQIVFEKNEGFSLLIK